MPHKYQRGFYFLHATSSPYCLVLPLIFFLHWLVVASCVTSVAKLLSCVFLLPSCCVGWLLFVALPLLPYRLAPPSHPLVVSAGCCVLSVELLPYHHHSLE